VPGGRDLDAFKTWVEAQFDPGVTWKDIDWLRGLWQGRLLLKGILDPDDARAAVASGADGLVVSNHGGRQLDSAPASLAALPAIARAVGASRPKSWWMAACAAAPTCSRRSLSAHAA
jgi:L-lactate dehydrogenase (cytochrome)